MVRMNGGEKHPPYAYMIQEALLSEERRSLSNIFISEYILSNYPCLLHDDDHTALLNHTLQDLTKRKSLSVVIDIEDQSTYYYTIYTLEAEIYHENTGAERPTTASHLRPSNYPKVVVEQDPQVVVAQHPQGRKEEENGIRVKKRKSKTRSVQEIMRIDDEEKGVVPQEVLENVLDEEAEKGVVLQEVLENVLDEEAEKGVVQNVLKNVLEAKIAAVARAVIAQVACGIERQSIVEQVTKIVEGMVLDVSESIVEIAAAAAETAVAEAAAAAAANYDEDALENTEDHQNDDD